MGCWLVKQYQTALHRLGQAALFTIFTLYNAKLKSMKDYCIKIEQIISPQNQKGRVVVTNSHTSSFWNKFLAAKINLPFKKSIFVDHWVKNCHYRTSVISTYLQRHCKAFLIKAIKWQQADKSFHKKMLAARCSMKGWNFTFGASKCKSINATKVYGRNIMHEELNSAFFLSW